MIRVIDLSSTPAGAFAALLLAELNADVIKVEPSTGDPLRHSVDSDGLTFAFLNRRKRSVTLDLTLSQQRDALHRLLATADVMVEDAPPGHLAPLGLAWPDLHAAHPNLVLASVTPFGQTGPRADWKASEFVLQAMGGVVHTTGWDDGTPQRLPGYQAHFVGGLQTASAALAAVWGVQTGAAPAVHLDISIQEAMATYHTRDIGRYAYTGQDVQRFGREFGMQGWPPIAVASDGYVMIEALRAEWEPFAFFLGLDDRFLTHEFHEPEDRAARWSEIQPDFDRAIRARSKRQWMVDSAAQGYTFAPIDTLAEVLTSPQLAARNFFETLEGADLSCPRPPFTHEIELFSPNRPPALGEHTRAVLLDELGLTPADLGLSEHNQAIQGSTPP